MSRLFPSRLLWTLLLLTPAVVLSLSLSRGADPAKEKDPGVSALKAASALYGRDAQLDAYLRGQRHFPADWLHEQELALEMARLGEVLAGVAAP